MQYEWTETHAGQHPGQGAPCLSSVNAVIDKAGMVQNLKAISGPQELRQSAIDAAREWKYKPYLRNGDPVEVKTSINIIYALGG